MIDSPVVDRDGRPGTAAPTEAMNEIMCNSKAVAYDDGPAGVRPVQGNARAKIGATLKITTRLWPQQRGPA